ncbi:MAG: hypothetical protein ACJAWA_001278 [Nonlabens sp.]|jgi:hypothetical protein
MYKNLLRTYFIVYFFLFLISFYTLIFARFYTANFLLFVYCTVNCLSVILIFRNVAAKECLLFLVIINIVQSFNFTVFGFNYYLLSGPELSLILDFDFDKMVSTNFSPLFLNFDINFEGPRNSAILMVNFLHLLASLIFLRIKQKS